MNRIRRVGTLSSGVIMVALGIVFLLRLAVPWLNFRIILSFWPVILIMLGVEMLYSYTVAKDDKVKYDVGAILIILTLCVFAMCMAGSEIVLDYISNSVAQGL